MEHDKLGVTKTVAGLLSSNSDSSVSLDKPLINDISPTSKVFYNLYDEKSINKKGATSIALIHNWLQHKVFIDEIKLSILKGAYVYGGKISSRKGTFHFDGQLLLTSSKKLINSSFGIMDGNYTLSGNLISGSSDGVDYSNCKVTDNADYDGTILKGWYYFLGGFHRHFGHFLVEGLSRLWALDHLPKETKENLKFVIYENELKNFMVDFLLLYGIDKSNIISAGKCSRYENLLVPDPSYRTHRWISKSFQNHIEIIKSKIQTNVKNRKIFLSRSNVSDRPLSNRKQVEKFFEEKGYEIICPEKLTIKEQIKNMMESSSIVGEVGSQLYLSSFAQKNANLFVMAPTNFCLKDDYLLTKAAGVNIKILLGSCVDFNSEKFNRQWSVDIKKIEKIFR